MTSFTEWCHRSRAADGWPASPELKERLATELYDALNRHFQAELLPSFGLPQASDLAADQIADLLVALEGTTHALPAFVNDSKTLRIWAFKSAWWKLGAILRRRSFDGFSGFGGDADGSVGPLVMQNREDDTHRGDALDPAALGVEVGEALRLGLQDVQAWWRYESEEVRRRRAPGHVPPPDWSEIFISVILKDRRQTEIARELNIVDGDLSRWLDRGRFCIGKRMQMADDQLIAEFGPAKFNRLAKAYGVALGRGA